MLTRNGLAKKYFTERYNILRKIPRILRHIYNRWFLIIQHKPITLHLHLHYKYNNIYCIWIYSIITFLFFMVKFWQVSNIALKSSCRRCSIKKVVLKKAVILIGMPGTLLQKVSNIVVFLWILRKFLKTSILKEICERLLLNFN